MAELNLDYFKKKLAEGFTLTDFENFTDMMEQVEWGLNSESVKLQDRYNNLLNPESGDKAINSTEKISIETRLIEMIIEVEMLQSKVDLYTLSEKEFLEKIENSNQPVLVAFTFSSDLTLELPIVRLNEATEGNYTSYILDIEQNKSILSRFGMKRHSAFYIFFKSKVIAGTFHSREFIQLAVWYDAIVNDKLSELKNGNGTVLLTVSDELRKDQKKKEEIRSKEQLYDKALEELSALKKSSRNVDYFNLMKKYYFMFDAILENGIIIPNFLYDGKRIADFAIVVARRVLNKPDIHITLILTETEVFDENSELTNSITNAIQRAHKLIEELNYNPTKFQSELKQQLVTRELELLGIPELNGMYRSVFNHLFKTEFFLATLILANRARKLQLEDIQKMSLFNNNKFSFGLLSYERLFLIWKKKYT